MITTLEQLPDEIFLEIFEYLPMRNLYRSFSGLNQRINSILGSVQTQLTFRWVRPEEIHYPFVTFFAVHLRKLLICHSSSLNLVHFPNIRHLQLEKPTIEQCNAIQPYILPHLEYICINNSKTNLLSIAFHQLCSSLFSGEFLHLHTCILINIQFNHRWSFISCALRSIQIDVQSCQDLAHLLKICPQLVRLKVMLDDECFNFQQWKICQILQKLNLYLRINNWSDEQVESFLSMLPNLESLSIQTPFDQQSQITIESLANVLRKCTPKLKNFFINTMINKLPSTDDIRQLHPLFKCIRVSQLVTTQSEYITISSRITNE